MSGDTSNCILWNISDVTLSYKNSFIRRIHPRQLSKVDRVNSLERTRQHAHEYGPSVYYRLPFLSRMALIVPRYDKRVAT